MLKQTRIAVKMQEKINSRASREVISRLRKVISEVRSVYQFRHRDVVPGHLVSIAS